MRLSSLLGRTLRDTPSEAEQIGHQLVLRAGLARPLAPGSFAMLPLGMAVLRRIEAIMHEELAVIGAQELRSPVIQPAALWEQSGRYNQYGPQMLRLQDRAERPLVVAPTHEEAIAELARREIGSYRQLPALVYQIHTKYRDETRTKGGLMRMREFTMLDGYSLDADDAGLDATYTQVAGAFERVFERCGVRYVAVEAGAGEMGGREPREYMARSPSGEDMLAICPGCGYAANMEVAVSAAAAPRSEQGERGEPPAIEPVATPGAATIAELAAFLGIPESATAKAVFFDTPERGLVFAVIRGDLEISEAKLQAAARVSELRPASAEQIAAAGAVAGYASPVGLRVAAGDGSEGVYVITDRSVAMGGGLVAGANRAGYHLRHVTHERDWRATAVADLAAVQAGDACARCGTPLTLERGVEIGHIFKLGTRFSEALSASYLDEQGAQRPIVMGSYGIGLERLLQIVVEQHHDERGIVWPVAVAPADVQIVPLGRGETPKAEAARIYAELRAAGLRPLLDDRDETAGVKFNDADLIGLPLRLVVGEKGLAAGTVELKRRDGAEAVSVPRSEVVAAVRERLR